MVVLVGASDEVFGKSFQLHQIQQKALVTPLVKGFFKPVTVDEVPQAVLNAVELARHGEPGPTVVEISSTLLMGRVRFARPTISPSPVTGNISAQLDEAADSLRNSPAVGIYAGAGAVGATEELKALAELIQAPVATTISGRGVLAEDHPLSVGFGFGRAGTAPIQHSVFSPGTIGRRQQVNRTPAIT